MKITEALEKIIEEHNIEGVVFVGVNEGREGVRTWAKGYVPICMIAENFLSYGLAQLPKEERKEIAEAIYKNALERADEPASQGNEEPDSEE